MSEDNAEKIIFKKISTGETVGEMKVTTLPVEYVSQNNDKSK
ncbi:hypothetical protein P8843_06680 [Bacillus inaquosorum]|nr:hypothetical protein [Bacillus inaquosorum]